jgi:bis(5'-nucleosidyl)-tetraphosphatase
MIILDKNTSEDLSDLTKPISAGYLLKCYLQGNWPSDLGSGANALPQRQRKQRARKGAAPGPLAEKKEPKKEEEELPEFKSCGALIYCELPETGKHFLLMKHHERYDLPKGHVDAGETDLQCALREMNEETGVAAEAVEIDPNFVFEEVYYPNYRRAGLGRVKKTLRIFLAKIQPEERKGKKVFPSIIPTEHIGFEWIPWNPPYPPIDIQRNTINPLFACLRTYWTTGSVEKATAGDNNSEVSTSGQDVAGEEEAGTSGSADDGVKETAKHKTERGAQS